MSKPQLAAGNLAIYERRLGRSRVRHYDANIEAVRGGKARIAYRDDQGRICTGRWVSAGRLTVTGGG